MGILRVTIDETTPVTSKRARLHLVVQGRSDVLLSALDQQGHEVRRLTAALTNAGLSPDRIRLDGTSLGPPPSSARGHRTVHHRVSVTADAGQVARVFDLVSGWPGVTVGRTEWLYDEYEASLPLLAAAMVKAWRKAAILARAAHVKLIDIQTVSDTWTMPEPAVAGDGPDPAAPVELSQTRDLHVHLTVDFEVGKVVKAGPHTAHPVASPSRPPQLSVVGGRARA